MQAGNLPPARCPGRRSGCGPPSKCPRELNGYDLTGTQISFRLRIDANGPVTQIVYFNGRRVALGTDLEPIVLFADAHPGDKVLVAVKLLHSEDQKRFRGSELNIQFAANRPNPEDFREEAVIRFPAAARPRRGRKRHFAEAAKPSSKA